mgnify:FL=1
MNMRSHPVWLGAKAGRSLPIEYFVLVEPKAHGDIIGQLAGQPIHDMVVDASGSRYHFVGVAPRDGRGRFDVEALRKGEWIVQPGLVYAADLPSKPSGSARRDRF